MSRIGKKPITIPAGVEVTLEDSVMTVKGPNGTLSQKIDESLVSVSIEDGTLSTDKGCTAIEQERAIHYRCRTPLTACVYRLQTRAVKEHIAHVRHIGRVEAA